jgi:hypothetical protein
MQLRLGTATWYIQSREVCAIQRPKYAAENIAVIHGREHVQVRRVVMNRELNLVGCAVNDPNAARDVGPGRSCIGALEDASIRACYRRVEGVRVQWIADDVANRNMVWQVSRRAVGDKRPMGSGIRTAK